MAYSDGAAGERPERESQGDEYLHNGRLYCSLWRRLGPGGIVAPQGMAKASFKQFSGAALICHQAGLSYKSAYI